MPESTPERTITEALSVASSRKLREVAVPCGFRAVNVKGDKIEMVADRDGKKISLDLGPDGRQIKGVRFVDTNTGVASEMAKGRTMEGWLELFRGVGVSARVGIGPNMLVEPRPGEQARVNPKGFNVAFSGMEENFQPKEVRIIEIG